MAPRLIVLAIAVFFSLGSPGPVDPPSSDTCDDGMATSVTSIQLGSGSPFTPFAEGEILEIVTGPQGGDMVPVRVQTAGGSSCMEQTTEILAPNGYVLAIEPLPIRFREQGTGVFVSGEVWLIFNEWSGVEGTWATLRTTVGTRVGMQNVWLGRAYDGPSLSWPVDPVVIAVGQDFPVYLQTSAEVENGATYYIQIADESILTSTNGGFGYVEWGATETYTMLRGLAPGTTEVTVHFGQDSATTTITVE